MLMGAGKLGHFALSPGASGATLSRDRNTLLERSPKYNHQKGAQWMGLTAY